MKQLNLKELEGVCGGEVGATGMGGNTAYTGEYPTEMSVSGAGYDFRFEVWDQLGVMNVYGSTPNGDSGWSSCWVSGGSGGGGGRLECVSALFLLY